MSVSSRALERICLVKIVYLLNSSICDYWCPIAEALNGTWIVFSKTTLTTHSAWIV